MEEHRKVNFRRLGTNRNNSDSGKTEKDDSSLSGFSGFYRKGHWG